MLQTTVQKRAEPLKKTAVTANLPPVTILVLNYNGRSHLPPNLASLQALNYPADKVDILLADNASNDDSVGWVQANYPQVRVLQTGQNLGFAGGNNAAAAAATTDWIAILNPDTRAHPDWLRELMHTAHQNPAAACIAAKMLNWEGTQIDFADAAINFMGWGNQPGLGSTDLDAFSQSKKMLFACGGAMLVRRSTFLEMGGFDPDYFAYFEDVDLGWRMALRGLRVVFAPKAIVYHRHHGSWSHVSDAKKWLLSERNTLFTILKNYDDDSLARILPGALLLLWQRAYLDARPDPARWGLPANAPPIIRLYYVYSMMAMVRNGRFPELWQLGKARLHRTLRRQSAAPQPAPNTNNPFTLPGTALSRLLAGRDVQQQWDTLMHKRQSIQQQRTRSDAEIFPLFQTPLISNFGDMDFIYAMTHVAIRFRLTRLFAQKPLPPIKPETRALSTAVSRRLLRLMDAAFTHTAANPADFRMGDGTPQPAYPAPEACAALLAHVNYWLWTLPRGDLPAVLRHLQARLDQWDQEHHDLTST